MKNMWSKLKYLKDKLFCKHNLRVVEDKDFNVIALCSKCSLGFEALKDAAFSGNAVWSVSYTAGPETKKKDPPCCECKCHEWHM